MLNMKKVAIIGAGASGLAAAVSAAREGASVCLYEQQNMPGKKLLATGNGKCNYLNEDQSMCHFHSQNPDLAEKILAGVSYEELLVFFQQMGIMPHSRNGYLYPMSGQAQSIHMALIDTAKSMGCTLICSSKVRHIERSKGNFLIETENESNMRADAIILAAGTRAGTREKEHPAYALAKSFGHHFLPYAPALCALRSDAVICRYWHGVRTKAALTLLIDGERAAGENGELMLTDYGISGIPAFQVSYLVTPALLKKSIVSVVIDWLPELEEASLMAFLDNLGAHFTDRKLSALLYGILPVKIADSLIVEATKRETVFKGCAGHLLAWCALNDVQKNCIIRILKHFELHITGVNDFEHAQVCSGGIPLTEIETGTCMSKKKDGLFLTGELLDVNGDCGGYNLQWAWTTGILAGRAAAKKKE